MNTELAELIRQTIRAHGPQSFAWFMQQTLYHPRHGYYSAGRAAIGRKGDYFTNVSIGPLFGQLLAAQFNQIWEQLGKIDNFFVVEQGAHDGQFAHDVLDSIQKRTPEFFAALRYRIIEPFLVWQDRQRKTLESFRGKVEWRDAIEPFTGVHFSNELLDAMPVDLPGKLVDLDRDDNFVFVERSTGKAGEFNQAALDWIDNIAANLQRGYVIAIDYGDTRREQPLTVQVRAQHRHLDSPFEQIGHADITAPVDWSSIMKRAGQAGLHVAGFTDQHHFLTGIISELGKGRSSEPPAGDCGQSPLPEIWASPKIKRELQTLLHPEMLGRSFQVLTLAKNVDRGLPLAGLKFARSAAP